MADELSGKMALVTGGSQGIGAAIATRLAAEGATVIVVASGSVAKAQNIADQIIAAGGKASADAADVSDVKQVAGLIERTVQQYGQIDILVNCAGVFYPTPVGETSADDLDRMVDINLKGTLHMINAVAPVMKKNGGGKIMNTSSSAAFMGLGGYSLYCALKAGIAMLTRSLAIELGPHNINVNAIAPGNTATPMNLDIRTEPDNKEFLDAMAEKTPSVRTFSDPEDMAELAFFLLSDRSRAMHGSTVLIDEGFSAGM